MRKLLLTIVIPVLTIFPSIITAATFTWNGITSSWADPSNWMVGGMPAMSAPGPADDVIINDPMDKIPVLPMGGFIFVNSISVTSGAELDLNGQTLLVLGNGSPSTEGVNFDNAVIKGNVKGVIICLSIVEIANTVFESNIDIQKSGGSVAGTDVLSGGNTFEGIFEFSQGSGATGTIFGNSLPDDFQMSATFTNTSTVPVEIAYGSAGNSFDGNLQLESTSTGGFTIGANGGTTTLAGRLSEGSGFTSGALSIEGLTQTGSNVNGTFLSSSFIVDNSTLRGAITVLALSKINIQNSTFASIGGSNSFDTPIFEEVANSIFSLNVGSTIFTKLSNLFDDTWSGGNQFGAVEIINLSTTNNLRLATSSANDFNKSVFFSNSGGGGLEPAFGASSTFAGNISTNGNINFGQGGGTVVIDGSAPQTLTSLSGTVTMVNLTMSQTVASTFTPTNTAICITGVLTLSSGIFMSSSMTPLIVLKVGATASSGNNQSYVKGKLKKIGNDAFTFPVGDGGFVAPIGITAPNSPTDEFTAEYFYQTPPNNMSITTPPALDHISTLEYWNLSGTSNERVTLSWDSRSGGVDVLPQLRVTRFSGSNWSSLPSTASGSTAMGSITTNSDLSTYGNFTLGSTTFNNPLPVELLYFTAEADGPRVRLDWATASEFNHAAFHIERSADGEVFEPVHVEAGDGRDSYETKTYRWYDEDPLPDISYYRLRQVDVDGTVDFSEIRSVRFESNDLADLRIFPNPAVELLRLSSEADLSDSDIRLFTSVGQEVALQLRRQGKEVDIPVAGLASGVYILQVRHQGQITTERVVIGR